MSKELIEQLAKEHGSIIGRNNNNDFICEFTSDQLEAFAKAYQAAERDKSVEVLLEALRKIQSLTGCSNAEQLEAMRNIYSVTKNALSSYKPTEG